MKALAQILCAALVATPALAAPPALKLTLTGEAEIVFDPAHDACDGHDVPDVNPRAYRNAAGEIVMFALHYTNRPLRGPSLEAAMKVDCRPAYNSGFNPDPSAYAAQNWIAATWTPDGRRIEAIVHHEYRAGLFKRCSVPAQGLACWYNTLLAVRSDDGGARFRKHADPVVAAAPFRQDVQQQRHRGFFNPSNIFGDGSYLYFFAAQTGWTGQVHGVCLFRSADPAQPRSWRAFDGRAFAIRYDDPYRPGLKQPRPCKPVEPFPASVGAVVRHRPSGIYLAIVQAWTDGKHFPVPGFYYATSGDLLRWSDPRLLMMTKTLYDDPCGAADLNSYPSILDPVARGRNFDDAGSKAYLYWSNMRVEGCRHTGDRKLLRRNMVIELINSVRQ